MSFHTRSMSSPFFRSSAKVTDMRRLVAWALFPPAPLTNVSLYLLTE